MFIIFIDSLAILSLSFLGVNEPGFFVTHVYDKTRAIVIVGVEFLVSSYAMLISWRAYERTKGK